MCQHDERDGIDEALVGGDSNRSVAQKFDVSPDAARRHRLAHLSPALVSLQAERDRERGESLLDRIEELIGRTERLLTAAEESGKVAQALAAVRELRALLELSGRASGELKDGPQVVVNLQSSAEWLAVRTAIMAVLAVYPEARHAVAGRLLELEAGP